jgi:hypothetical protein
MQDGSTPLLAAAREGDVAILSALLAAGADINAEDDAGRSALLWAAAEGRLEAVQHILAVDGTQLDAATRSGNTPLHRAAAYGHREVVSLLLTAGADIDCVNEEGATALSRAARWGHADVVRLLLKAGADPEVGDGNGRLPRAWAASKRFREVLDALDTVRPEMDSLSPTVDRERAKMLAAVPAGGGREGEEGEYGEGEEEDGPLRVEGWMAKQGHIIRNWKNRWFILDGRRVFYYAKEGAKAPKGVIRMVQGTEVIVEERYARPFCFTLKTPKKRFIVQAANEEEQAQWIAAIEINLELVDPSDADEEGEAGMGDDD